MISFSRTSKCTKLSKEQLTWLTKQPTSFLTNNKVILVSCSSNGHLQPILDTVVINKEKFIILAGKNKGLLVPNKMYHYNFVNTDLYLNYDDYEITEFMKK